MSRILSSLPSSYKDRRAADKRRSSPVFHIHHIISHSCFRLVLEKMELDKCRKDTQHTKYPEGMHVEVVFQSVLLEYLKSLPGK
jgi:hypothetical protein